MKVHLIDTKLPDGSVRTCCNRVGKMEDHRMTSTAWSRFGHARKQTLELTTVEQAANCKLCLRNKQRSLPLEE